MFKRFKFKFYNVNRRLAFGFRKYVDYGNPKSANKCTIASHYIVFIIPILHLEIHFLLKQPLIKEVTCPGYQLTHWEDSKYHKDCLKTPEEYARWVAKINSYQRY